MSCSKASCPLRLIRHTWRRLVRDPLAKNPGLIRRPGSLKQPRIADVRDAQRRPAEYCLARVPESVTDRVCPSPSISTSVPVAEFSHPDALSPVNNDNPHGYLHRERGPRTSTRLSKANISRSPSEAPSEHLCGLLPARGGEAYAPSVPPEHQVRQVCLLADRPAVMQVPPPGGCCGEVTEELVCEPREEPTSVLLPLHTRSTSLSVYLPPLGEGAMLRTVPVSGLGGPPLVGRQRGAGAVPVRACWGQLPSHRERLSRRRGEGLCNT